MPSLSRGREDLPVTAVPPVVQPPLPVPGVAPVVQTPAEPANDRPATADDGLVERLIDVAERFPRLPSNLPAPDAAAQELKKFREIMIKAALPAQAVGVPAVRILTVLEGPRA